MSATYIHTKRKAGFTMLVLRFLAFLYFAVLGASVVYLWAFTQDRFISTSEFKVSRQNLSSTQVGFAQLALPGLSDTGSVDSQIVIGFVKSADLLTALEKEYDLAAHYQSPKKDIVFRLAADANLDERLQYYRKRIASHFDMETGMTVITVETFDPVLSQKIAKSLLERTESYINQVNQDIADQQLSFVRAEVELSAKKVEEVNAEMIALQNENNFISPDEVISSTLGAIEKIRFEHLKLQAELATIERDSPNSPRVESLRSQGRSLSELISVESAKLSGPEKNRLNQLLVRFKLLEQRIAFAIQLRNSAEMLLERNRVDTVARSRFLTVIQHPYQPEDVGQPRRWYATVTLLTLGSLLFAIFRAITKAIFSMI